MKNSIFFTIVFCRKIHIFESYDQFDSDDTSSADCKAEFRIERAALCRLADVLQIPPVIKCRQRRLSDVLEGLCVLLRRTSYPCRCSDMIPRFPRPVSVLSLITNEVLNFIFENPWSQIGTEMFQTLWLFRYMQKQYREKGHHYKIASALQMDLFGQLKTWHWAKSRLQWTHESAWAKISVRYPTRWINWKYLWISSWALYLHCSIQYIDTRNVKIFPNLAG